MGCVGGRGGKDSAVPTLDWEPFSWLTLNMPLNSVLKRVACQNDCSSANSASVFELWWSAQIFQMQIFAQNYTHAGSSPLPRSLTQAVWLKVQKLARSRTLDRPPSPGMRLMGGVPAWLAQALFKMCNRHWLTLARTRLAGANMQCSCWAAGGSGGAASAVADIRCRKYAYKRNQHVPGTPDRVSFLRKKRLLPEPSPSLPVSSSLLPASCFLFVLAVVCLLCSARRRQRRKELKQNITAGRSCSYQVGEWRSRGPRAQKKFTIYLVKCN